ncbi:putative tpa inducible protein [Golovinomyces cichoracearum]|uniref:Transcription initiation factor TFIID subunit 4 n=1 Tax=Golovinomyces cichoracearum TaxID=62708 RepID=A0A420IGW1_9PEZI|nr:putative tpa inducible protein [Golovinomyces cichoracearum]
MAQQPQPNLVPPQGPGSPPTSGNSPKIQPSYVGFSNKRPRLSPNDSSQPSSPYTSHSPYSHKSPSQTTQSSHFANISIPPQAYTTPYSNGHNNSNLGLSQGQINHQNGYQPNTFPFSNQNNFSLQQNCKGINALGVNTSSSMGPPSKPVEKPKDESVDVMDVLGGTGVDLREEEQYTFQLYNDSFNSMLSKSQSGNISLSHSFTQFQPGDEASFYGAGPANVVGESVGTQSQDEYIQKAADMAWREAARNLHISRQRELDNPFLHVHLVHAKLRKLASEYGIELNTDSKGMMGIMTRPHAFSEREVQVQTAVGPDGILVTTNGNFLPYDSMLVDQLALLSIATKHRLRGLVEDAVKIARGRRTGSHGVVAEEWKDVAFPFDFEGASRVGDGVVRPGWESSINPQTNPLKRSFLDNDKNNNSTINHGNVLMSSGKVTNEIIIALRRQALKEREAEEIRLRKRLDRASGTNISSRQTSSVPGTPGSVAPELAERVTTKKELKKKAEAKVNEAASHAAANVTTAQFLGGGGGLFGKKKKYSWMSPAPQLGSGGGATSAQRRVNARSGSSAAAASGSISNIAPAERLTFDGSRRLGTWREDREKGAGVQMRDWVTVLEQDNHEKKALQLSYMYLDSSDPR